MQEMRPISDSTVNIPAPVGWERAKLPALYEQAKRVLAECDSVDECRRWTARAEAIASYYRQLKDDSMVVFAQRIKLRAARRLGELLGIADRTIEVAADLPHGGHAPFGSTVLGKQHGMNHHEIAAVRKISNMSADEFERAVEAEQPRSVASFRAPSHHGARNTRGQERLEMHLRALAIMFTKRAPEAFAPIKNGADLRAVREALGRLK
jgi:hypothetical protein